MKKVGKITRSFRYDLNQISYSDLQIYKFDLQIKYSGRGKYIQRIRSDRVPEQLWIEVHDIVQEAGIKAIPRKKMKKGKIIV